MTDKEWELIRQLSEKRKLIEADKQTVERFKDLDFSKVTELTVSKETQGVDVFLKNELAAEPFKYHFETDVLAIVLQKGAIEIIKSLAEQEQAAQDKLNELKSL